MENLFRGLCPRILLIFLDDLIIHSRDWDQHLSHLRQVFQIFRAAGLKLKSSKCCFARSSVKFLGHIVYKDGIRCDPNNVKCVRDFKTPTKLKELQSFLGLANYYRKCIRGFCHKARPLTNLLRKGVKFQFTEECHKAFQTLKTCLTSDPILAYPSFQHEFLLYTDASDSGIGVTYDQERENGPWPNENA